MPDLVKEYELDVEDPDIWVCRECGAAGPPLFVSPASNKVRVEDLNGVQAITHVQKNVCLECYREEFRKVHPDLEVPI